MIRAVRGVLDTNTVIMVSRITDPASLPAEPLITTVTLAELTVGPPGRDDCRGTCRPPSARPAGRGRL